MGIKLKYFEKNVEILWELSVKAWNVNVAYDIVCIEIKWAGGNNDK